MVAAGWGQPALPSAQPLSAPDLEVQCIARASSKMSVPTAESSEMIAAPIAVLSVFWRPAAVAHGGVEVGSEVAACF